MSGGRSGKENEGKNLAAKAKEEGDKRVQKETRRRSKRSRGKGGKGRRRYWLMCPFQTDQLK
jgi:hypothetical protein